MCRRDYKDLGKYQNSIQVSIMCMSPLKGRCHVNSCSCTISAFFPPIILSAHYVQHRGNCGNTYFDVVCRGNYTKRTLNTPLLYDLHADLGELYPLDTEKYSEVLKRMTMVR